MANFDSKSFNPQAFGAYVERIPQTKKNELIKSGALRGNAEIRNVFSNQTGTAYAVLPMYGLLDGEAQNYDGINDIEATTTKTYERGVVVVGRAKAWVEKDFSYDITAGVDFMDNVAQQVAEYYDNVDQDTLLAILSGIFSMSATKDKKFVDAHTYETDTLDATTLNTAIGKAGGDNKDKYTLVIMHSAVATQLENLNLLNYLKYTDSNGIQRDLGIATWNGRVVLVDDSMPVTEGDSTTSYTTYVLGDGAFDYENIGAKVPYEMDRDAKTAGGQDILYTRQRKVFAPYGISYVKKSQATLSPTNTELSDGKNWALVADADGNTIEPKAIPIARIVSTI
jgi:hypothetical protein